MAIFPVEIWGTVAAWVSAVGTSGSLMVAAGVYARGQWSARREQASQVRLVSGKQHPEFTVFLFNHSDKPIYDVNFWAHRIAYRQMMVRPDLKNHFAVRGFHGNLDFYGHWISLDPRFLTQPNHDEVPIKAGQRCEVSFDSLKSPGLRYSVEFNDARGLRWRQELDGSRAFNIPSIDQQRRKQTPLRMKVIAWRNAYRFECLTKKLDKQYVKEKSEK